MKPGFSAARQYDLPMVRAGAVKDGDIADPLHQRRFAAPDQVRHHRVAGFTVRSGDLDLDQFVMLQRGVHFGDHGVGDALGPDLQHRLQAMCLAAEEPVLCVGECDRHAEEGLWKAGGDWRAGYHGPQLVRFLRSCLYSASASVIFPMATRSKSSQRWLKEHFADPYVKKAQAEGLRSRAAYKLEELVERDRLLKPGMVVVDLGAAPGGWSQWVRQAMGDGGRVMALDILEMPSLAGVEFIHGDFREDEVLARLEAMLNGQPVDLVLSDMAPNMSGVDAVDLPRAMHLAELAMDFADRHLRPGGALLIKLFQGVGFDDYVRALRKRYTRVVIRKPAASRKRSTEVYALAQGRHQTAVV